MVVVTRGVDKENKPCKIYIDGLLQVALDRAVRRVTIQNWDYVCVVSGLPGSGKSTLARTIARYCCEWFDEKYIAFTDEDFIKITNEAPEFSAVILDESFASLNTRVSKSNEFLKIVNHLQLIRQKHLFIILCLPNFFDLSKGIAVFRSSHLFVVYSDEEGKRGKFLAFGRDTKRKLYVLGSKFMDYNVVKSNFAGRFVKNKDVVDENVYESLKFKHLQAQNKQKPIRYYKGNRDEVITKLKTEYNWKSVDIAKLYGIDPRSVSLILKKSSENLEKNSKYWENPV